MDGARLRLGLVDREHERAIHQLLVELYRGGGEHDHHRPFHAVLVRHEFPRVGILAGARDRELALAL